MLISRGEEAGRGRARPALLAATFEAILGALYFDQGLPATRDLIVRMIDDKTQGYFARAARPQRKEFAARASVKGA